MEKLEKALAFLKDYFKDEESIQSFDCRNFVGDILYPIYNKDGIRIEYDPRHQYIEIFGLTHDEYTKLCDMSNGFVW